MFLSADLRYVSASNRAQSHLWMDTFRFHVLQYHVPCRGLDESHFAFIADFTQFYNVFIFKKVIFENNFEDCIIEYYIIYLIHLVAEIIPVVSQCFPDIYKLYPLRLLRLYRPSRLPEP